MSLSIIITDSYYTLNVTLTLHINVMDQYSQYLKIKIKKIDQKRVYLEDIATYSVWN